MNPTLISRLAGVALAAALVAGPAVTGAAVAPDAVTVKSGGVSVEEFAALNREAGAHTLKLVLASKSGAYLADVDVTVRALPSREVVIEHRAQGPLMLATLPPGRYEVSATPPEVRSGAPRTLTRVVNVGNPGKGRAQVLMSFDTGDTVSPDSPAEYSIR